MAEACLISNHGNISNGPAIKLFNLGIERNAY